ncbi:MAG: hypothetical protein NTW07_13345 [candidate division Zixibacteria bacterium]|nr:hypothetical protein [candidate division Zixibacteria bacterium]
MWFERWLDQALLVGVILVAAAALSLAQTDSSKTPSGQTPTLLSSHDQTPAPDEFFILETQHKVFTGFHQIDTVRLNQKFPLGESDDVGEVFLFNPHFMITDSGKVMQLSDTLYNPAVRVRVTVGDSVVQESWAFYFSSAPHFRRNDMFGFRLVDFKVSDRFVRVAAPKPVAQPPSTDSSAKRQ